MVDKFMTFGRPTAKANVTQERFCQKSTTNEFASKLTGSGSKEHRWSLRRQTPIFLFYFDSI